MGVPDDNCPVAPVRKRPRLSLKSTKQKVDALTKTKEEDLVKPENQSFKWVIVVSIVCFCANGTDQPVYQWSLISLSCLREETLYSWLSKYAQWRFRSDCGNVQADLCSKLTMLLVNVS